MQWLGRQTRDQIQLPAVHYRVSIWMGDHLWMGKPSWYATSHLGQLSLLSIQSR